MYSQTPFKEIFDQAKAEVYQELATLKDFPKQSQLSEADQKVLSENLPDCIRYILTEQPTKSDKINFNKLVVNLVSYFQMAGYSETDAWQQVESFIVNYPYSETYDTEEKRIQHWRAEWKYLEGNPDYSFRCSFIKGLGLPGNAFECSDCIGEVPKSVVSVEQFKKKQTRNERQPELSLDFPNKALVDAAGFFANVYGQCIEAPEPFLFMGYLTGLSAAISPRLTIRSALKTQPRLFTVLLGASATERKSTAVGVVIKHFKSVLEKDFNACWGVGSAEGLQKILNKTDELEQKPIGTLLAFDELKAFVSKCNIDSSVLLPIVNTLFESNVYETHTKSKDIFVENAYLSLLAASTMATYERIYNSAFLDIGFPNRVFIVPGTAKRKFSIPPIISNSDEQEMKGNLLKVLRHVGDGLELDITEDAKAFYHDWYMSLEQSIHAKRLDTYSLRLMMLLAVNSLKSIIDKETVEHATALCDWQLEVRKLHDPIDAESNIAKMEEKIRRCLRKTPLKDWELKRNTAANRDGLWVYDTAKKNLQKAGEIDWEKTNKQWIYIR